jgi:hypothetical protein
MGALIHKRCAADVILRATWLIFVASCVPPRQSAPSNFEWPLGRLESETSTTSSREIRIAHDFGLGGPGPLIRILVMPTGVKGEAYVSYRVSDTTQSLGFRYAQEARKRFSREYRCRSFVTTKDEAVCRLPFHTQPNWARLLSRLDSLRTSAPVAPAKDPLIICSDYPGWYLTDRNGATITHDQTAFCGPGNPERAKYEKALWQILYEIDSAARFDLRPLST